MKYTFESGSHFDGAMDADGRFEGMGKFTFFNGDVHEGEFSSDMFQGAGTYTFASGAVYKGLFSGDFFYGIGVFAFPDGSVEKGKFHHDKRVGKFIRYDVSTRMYYEVLYENDNEVNVYGIEKEKIREGKSPLD